ncbi:hypothetical protein V6N11_063973 [Hibiscus sabdariffa]|uniref:Uncharacterized protein n=1 Tax=Hibiscus sabdariffa TaxID=183260 RepID=A0ABR2PMP6_9ROSI
MMKCSSKKGWKEANANGAETLSGVELAKTKTKVKGIRETHVKHQSAAVASLPVHQKVIPKHRRNRLSTFRFMPMAWSFTSLGKQQFKEIKLPVKLEFQKLY